ncbi:hypothetical protein FOF52_08065 [Thermobifida alba]|uniref:Uncharacterized protein n=1 Tax=Thermobifida alba TaxID=53522 RepID=A0ABY4L0Q3_THEAE|nr:hypothetical protein [Thermobifida alba]UPT20920.1 hypothetical protein FOF52_08065 [Thermobifida alba]
MEQLILVAARTGVGVCASSDLPVHAARAPVRGLDSPALRGVAGLGPADPSLELFAEALRELGVDWPDEPTTHLVLACEAASAIPASDDSGTVIELAESVCFHPALADSGHGRRLGRRFCAVFLVGDPADRERACADVSAGARALVDAWSPCSAGLP